MKRSSTAAVLLLVLVLLSGCTGLSDDGPGPDGVLNDTRNGSDADEDGSSATEETTNDSDGETAADDGETDGQEDDTAAGEDGSTGASDEEDDSADGRVWLSGRIQGIESTNTYTVELENGSTRTFRLADVQVLPRDDDPDLSGWSRHLSDADDGCVELQQDKAWEWASAFRFDDVKLTPVSDRRYAVYDEDGDDVAAQLLYDGLARVTGSDSAFVEEYREAQDRATGERVGIWSCADEAIIFE